MKEFSRRVAVASGILVGTLALVIAIWYAFDILLLLFAGCLLAVLFHGLSKWMARFLPVPHKAILGVIIALSIAGSLFGTWFYGSMFYTHFNQFVQSLTEAVDQLTAQYDYAKRVFSELTTFVNELSQIDILSNLRSFFSSTIGFLFNIFIVFFVGIYVAIDPGTYVNGFLALFPHSQQPRLRQVLINIYNMLKWWLLGRIISMLVIGLLTVVGLLVLDIPVPFTLGILAALLEFIPYLGPILAAIPAIIIALTVNPLTSMYVALLYFIIQQLEGYILTPIVQEESISMPPAMTLSIQILFGIAAGGIGLIMATPFAAVLIVVIQMLYVQDIIGNNIKVLGEH